MKLSMWIFANWLSDYRPEIFIQDGLLEIETVRLFSSNFSSGDNCLYIGRIRDLFTNGNDNVICTHKNDYILLPTDDMDEIMNQILNAFEYYQSWNVRTLEAISSDMRPADLLRIANEVIKEPIYLMDSNQFALALSEGYGKGSVNYLWDQMLENGSADYAFLKKLDENYPEHRTNRGLYYFNAPFIEAQNAHSYNYNMFLDDTWIGLCSMIETRKPFPRHTLDQFHIFCKNIELWYISHSQELRSLMIDSLFRDMLKNNDEADENFLRTCRLRFGSITGNFYILALKTPASHSLLMGHMCKEINLVFPNSIAIIYQNYICVMLNSKTDRKHSSVPHAPDTCLTEILPLLAGNSYYGGYSRPFTELKNIGDRFSEASFAAERMPPVTGQLAGFAQYALEYALQEIKNRDVHNLIHPAVSELMEYDRRHGSHFTQTLHIYLKKERSQSETAAALNLHRNSLTYRLQRIRELLDADLDDDDTRFHMLLSFRFLEK